MSSGPLFNCSCKYRSHARPPRPFSYLYINKYSGKRGENAMSRASPPPPLLLKKERPRRRCTAASQPVLLLSVVVGILAQGADSVTIEETSEWQTCVRSPTRCTTLDLTARGLTGTIPSSIGTFVNLKTV